jgi:hypothetical protein
VSPDTAERLRSRNIQLVSETKGHYVFARDNCLTLVERTEAGFGSIGSTGVMTEAGLAYLVWREGRAVLLGKGSEASAEPAQVEAIRRFSEDLKTALGGL